MRDITSAENLTAQVEGDVAEVDGVLRITAIRIQFRFRIPSETREAAERAVETFAAKCPAYQSVKECIACTWDAEIIEE